MYNIEKFSLFSSTKIIEEYNQRKSLNTKTRIHTNKKFFIGTATLILNYMFFKSIIFSALFFEFNQRKIKSGLSSINLKANGIGNVKVLSDKFKDNFPNEIWINNINQSEINNTYYLNKSENLITLYWYDKIETLNYMFDSCYNITEIDLSNFDTSQVTDMSFMFYGCSSLISLDLSNFNTSQVKDMGVMFCGCSSLISLDLSNFDTSQVNYMSSMFRECSSLISLDLSKFVTSQVYYMYSMFNGCSSLISLDLSNFDTSQVYYMDRMFNGCSSLISLDLSNFDTSKVYYMYRMFNGCSSLISLDLSNFDISNTSNIDSMFSNCSKLEYLNLENAILKDSILFNLSSDNLVVCSNKFDDIISESISINCINKTLPDENKSKCYSKNKNIYNKYICQNCGPNFHQKYNEIYNFNTYINCYESKNINCQYYFYLNLTTKIFYCTNEYQCPNDYSKLVLDRRECIRSCENDSIYKYEYNKTCYNKKMNQSVNDIIKNFINELNITDINNGNDKKIIEKNLILIFTSTQNQKNNENISNLTMNLGQCENLLKNKYNISKEDSLYMIQLLYEEEGKKIPKVEYEIYYPLYNNNLTKLDLSLCKDTKIEAVKINQPIDRYNSSSDYYNDICSKSSSSSGTDISLKDRRNEFVNNNMYLCEENCDLIDYNYETEKSKCSCDIKLNISSNFDVKFNKNEFFKNFIDINNIVNLNIMKCSKIVFKIKNLLKNYGFFIIIFIILIHIITLFVFKTMSYNKIEKEINNIFYYLNSKKIMSRIKRKDNKLTSRQIKKKEKEKIGTLKDKKNKSGDKLVKIEINQNKIQSYKNLSNNKININITRLETVYENNKQKNKFYELKDFEINILNYKQAIKLDHRSFYEYYISLLKYNHPLSFSFGTYDDYNSKMIKMFLFFFSFSSELTINALFFNDDTMHKIYQDKGEFDIIYQLTQIIYSTLISYIIDILVKMFALSQNDIVELKLKLIKNINNLKEKRRKILFFMKIKFFIFFLLTLLILIFNFYYITCFCGIYINTQSHLLKDSVFSLITSFITPILFNIIPAIFRVLALSVEKPNRECCYKLSLFLS